METPEQPEQGKMGYMKDLASDLASHAYHTLRYECFCPDLKTLEKLNMPDAKIITYNFGVLLTIPIHAGGGYTIGEAVSDDPVAGMCGCATGLAVSVAQAFVIDHRFNKKNKAESELEQTVEPFAPLE
ncbi:MAG: hypothetical protein GY861_27635 [bacterium]|nr:hypothetical protein [bacterium]